MQNLLYGFVIAVVVGIVLALILGETKVLFEALSPLINFIRSIPQTALVPLIIGAFGIGGAPKIMAIAFACVWPILLNAIDGVRGIEPTVRDAAQVYRIPKALYFRRILLPAALPQIVAGIRVALPIAIVMMVVSELFAAENGIGFYILNSSSRFKIPETWGGALLVGLLGYILSTLFIVLERRILRWYFLSAAK
ncbi:ABC-type nitrate/sulfonate/bicarbonate transport system permease component [Leucobacter exalbidus]|uniref:ABC-type nitrate/sulfonate/bicarbonate transport system permease component n=1 Tax=Leucobacter exalbidus TaxID=662960 RepID=A0A940PUB3_9MICO|nr:ABC transporter permease subunit [Leucobacter exalbidus]MBP1326345.1 ABC-type nitrate/sulfonate/bicarbonate transport system permease component [Leucobacter exalbidus]